MHLSQNKLLHQFHYNCTSNHCSTIIILNPFSWSKTTFGNCVTWVQKCPHPGQHWCNLSRFLWISQSAKNGIFTAGRTSWGLVTLLQHPNTWPSTESSAWQNVTSVVIFWKLAPLILHVQSGISSLSGVTEPVTSYNTSKIFLLQNMFKNQSVDEKKNFFFIHCTFLTTLLDLDLRQKYQAATQNLKLTFLG